MAVNVPVPVVEKTWQISKSSGEKKNIKWCVYIHYTSLYIYIYDVCIELISYFYPTHTQTKRKPATSFPARFFRWSTASRRLASTRVANNVAMEFPWDRHVAGDPVMSVMSLTSQYWSYYSSNNHAFLYHELYTERKSSTNFDPLDFEVNQQKLLVSWSGFVINEHWGINTAINHYGPYYILGVSMNKVAMVRKLLRQSRSRRDTFQQSGAP